MDQTPLSIWQRPWRGPAKTLAWFGLLAFATFVAIGGIGLVTHGFTAELILYAFLGAVGLAGLLFAGLWSIRWLSSWRNLRRLLFALVCLATLIALAYSEENWRGKHAWQKYRREWEAKGEKFDLAAFTPRPVPDDKNFALTPLLKPALDYTNGPQGIVWQDTNGLVRLEKISADIPRSHGSDDQLGLGGLEKGTFADLKTCADFYRGNTNYPQAAASATDAETVLVALGKFEPELKELREAAVSRPGCRFPIHYGQEPSWGILLPHLAHLKGLTMLAQIRATAELAAGHPAEAFEDLKLGFRLSGCLHDEPFLISHLVRLATLTINLQTMREGLNRHAWTETQLAALETQLAGLDLLAEYKFTMRGERACTTFGLDYVRRNGFQASPVEYITQEGGSGSAPPLGVLPSGWICQNMLTIARMHQEFYLPSVDERTHRVFPEVSEAGRGAIEKMSLGPYTIFARMLLPALENSVRKAARMQTYVDSARVACALERYRLVNGKLPDTLDALAPRFLAAIPNDVIDGKPLRYRLNSDGSYLLYSIGWNQTDDGGQLAFLRQKDTKSVDLTQGDWVWMPYGGDGGDQRAR